MDESVVAARSTAARRQAELTAGMGSPSYVIIFMVCRISIIDVDDKSVHCKQPLRQAPLFHIRRLFRLVFRIFRRFVAGKLRPLVANIADGRMSRLHFEELGWA